MRSFWLNVILRLSNRVYREKQSLILQKESPVIVKQVTFVVLKTVFVFVSFPLYLIVRPQKVTVCSDKEGLYANATWNYKVFHLLG